MPASLAIDDLILVSIRGLLFEQRIISTYHYVVTAVTGTPLLTTALDNLLTKFSGVGGPRATYLACCAPEYTMQEVWAQRIAPTRMMASRLNVDLTGLFVDDVYATANSAAAITRRAELASRTAVSTLHIPIGQSPDAAIEGKIATPLLGALNAHAAQIPLDLTTVGTVATFTPCLPNTGVPAASLPIVSAFVQDTVRVMRRRTLRLGE